MNPYVLAAVLVLVMAVAVPPIIKKSLYKKLMQQVQEKDFSAFEKDIDSFACKMTFSAFERESIRLSMYEMMGDLNKADEQVQFMEKMRLSSRQKAALGERGFYVYLEQGKIKKAKKMLDLVQEYGSEAQYQNLEILYSILLKKESRYIEEVKRRLNQMWDGTTALPDSMKPQVGTFEYLIGLQYSYLKDAPNAREWLIKAREHLKDTPDLYNIDRILSTLQAAGQDGEESMLK